MGQYAAALLDHLLAADPELTFSLFAVGRQRGPASLPGGDRAQLHRLKVPARLVVAAWEIAGHPAGERFFGPADVVHGTNFWVPPLRRPNGVVTIHDLTFLLHPELCTPQVRRYNWILPGVLRRCAVVLVPSRTVATQVAAELGFPPDRIVVTPEGIRSGALDKAEPAAVPGDYVLFTGTQEPRKNLDRLLAAFGDLKDLDLRLVIAGPGGWGPVDLRLRAEELGVADRVTFTGYVPDAHLAGLLAGARAFVFPSLYEGFGLPPLEAMAAGIPVVAASAGSLPEVLGDAPLWCDPLDPGSIAAAIRRAVTDDAARVAATTAGRAQAARYTWRETARLTLEAYRRAAEG